MVFSEHTAYLFKGHIRKGAQSVNTKVSCINDIRVSLAGCKHFFFNRIFFADIIKDILYFVIMRLGGFQIFAQHGNRHIKGYLPVLDKGMGFQLFNCAFYLTDICFNIFRKEGKHVIGYINTHIHALFLKNSGAQLGIRRFYVRNQAHFTAAFKPVLKVNFLGRSVGCDYNLLLLLKKCVYGVEKLFLSFVLSFDKLNIVDKQNVHAAVLFSERHVGFLHQ